jgi:hypothetical protein
LSRRCTHPPARRAATRCRHTSLADPRRLECSLVHTLLLVRLQRYEEALTLAMRRLGNDAERLASTVFTIPALNCLSLCVFELVDLMAVSLRDQARRAPWRCRAMPCRSARRRLVGPIRAQPCGVCPLARAHSGWACWCA